MGSKPMAPRIYRATTEAWVGQLVLPLVFFSLLTVTLVRAAGVYLQLGTLGVGAVVIVLALDGLLPMLRNWIELDTHKVEGSLNGHYFHLLWHEVLAAWVVKNNRRVYLYLGTRDGTMMLPLRFMDDRAIWAHIRSQVSADALKADAVRRLPDHRLWEADLQKAASSQALTGGVLPGQSELQIPGGSTAQEAEGLKRPGDPSHLGQSLPAGELGPSGRRAPTIGREQKSDRAVAEDRLINGPRIVTDHWLLQVAGWTGMSFCLLGLADEVSAGNWLPAGIFLALSAISFLMLVSWGVTQFNADGVERFTLFGAWRIPWCKVTSIEIDPLSTAIVLVGENRRLSIPGPVLWSGGGKKAALAVLLGQAGLRCIPLRRTMRALVLRSNNTRIKK